MLELFKTCVKNNDDPISHFNSRYFVFFIYAIFLISPSETKLLIDSEGMYLLIIFSFSAVYLLYFCKTILKDRRKIPLAFLKVWRSDFDFVNISCYNFSATILMCCFVATEQQSYTLSSVEFDFCAITNSLGVWIYRMTASDYRWFRKAALESTFAEIPNNESTLLKRRSFKTNNHFSNKNTRDKSQKSQTWY